jgi:hypothetical protein
VRFAIAETEMMRQLLAAAAVAAVVLVVLVAADADADADAGGAAPTRRLPVEHMFYDVTQNVGDATLAALLARPRPTARPPVTVDGDAAAIVVPVSLKARCKGAGCPALDGRAAVVAGSRWASLNGRRVFVEETSGWMFLWHDAARAVPVVPSRRDQQDAGRGEKGYLKGSGVLLY